MTHMDAPFGVHDERTTGERARDVHPHERAQYATPPTVPTVPTVPKSSNSPSIHTAATSTRASRPEVDGPTICTRPGPIGCVCAPFAPGACRWLRMTAPTTPPPPVDLTRLEQLAESATPGPWRTERWSLGLTIEAQGGYLLESDDGAMPVVEREPDAEFIAALRNAAPQLLAASRAVERVRALHTPDPAGWCDGCEFSWPCGTIRALDGSDA